MDALWSSTAARALKAPDVVSRLSTLLASSEDDVRAALAKSHGRTLVRNVFKASFVLTTGEPLEEHDEGGPTGVEEEIAYESPSARPYDPDKIRVDPKTFSLAQVIEDIKEGDIDLAPDFQRQEVWGARQKVRLIESVLLRIPLPAFYFSADKAGRLSVVDGVQRLSALRDFFAGAFSLTQEDLEYLHVSSLCRRGGSAEPDACSVNDLDGQWLRRMRQTQLTTYVIDPQTPEQVKFDIFRRINTGGSPLNAQEIRHSMMGPRARDLLRTLAASEAFRRAVPSTLWDHPRMADREAILRLLAFALLADVDQYPDTTLDEFLLDAARRLDDSADIDDDAIDTLRWQFEQAMSNAALLFGDRAFRKWSEGSERKTPFNRALFDSWGYALMSRSPESLEPHKDAIVQALRELMMDRDYAEAITVGTGDTAKVKARFAAAQHALARCIP